MVARLDLLMIEDHGQDGIQVGLNCTVCGETYKVLGFKGIVPTVQGLAEHASRHPCQPDGD
jgi:hypothetical protein